MLAGRPAISVGASRFSSHGQPQYLAKSLAILRLSCLRLSCSLSECLFFFDVLRTFNVRLPPMTPQI